MAHNFKIVTRPHKNKDGTDSKSRHDYVVIDRTRSGSHEVGVATSKKAADQIIDVERSVIAASHINKHPNDKKFLKKHRGSD